MDLFIKTCLLWLINNASCWKPIDHPASFNVHQTFQTSDSGFNARISNKNAISSDSSFLLDKNGFTNEGTCAVDKFAIDHESIVKYDTDFAKLDQFTICMWARFTKHDGDHVMFTYSVSDEAREIQFWIANSNSSSFISMAVRGHSLYRLNYPLAMRKWHHMCSSWNGKTGEWQLWVKSERVGRGFYNRLVSHEIESGGNAFTGGKSPNGVTSTDLHFEITLLQIYSVALSAGKAHRNHKHHHVHMFDFNGEIEPTTTVAPPSMITNQQVNPLLANGQFPTNVKINLAGVQQSNDPQLLPTLSTNFVQGQFHAGSRNLQQQLLNGNILQEAQNNQKQQLQSIPEIYRSSSAVQFPEIREIRKPFTSTYTGFGSNPANVQIFDDTNFHNRFKRDSEKVNKKRDLITLTDGSIVDDQYFDTKWYDGLAQFGDKGFKQSLSKRDNLEDQIKEHDREPAEGEVEAVRSYCNHCLVEPFQNALVLAWKSAVPAHNILKAKASTVCGDF